MPEALLLLVAMRSWQLCKTGMRHFYPANTHMYKTIGGFGAPGQQTKEKRKERKTYDRVQESSGHPRRVWGKVHMSTSRVLSSGCTKRCTYLCKAGLIDHGAAHTRAQNAHTCAQRTCTCAQHAYLCTERTHLCTAHMHLCTARLLVHRTHTLVHSARALVRSTPTCAQNAHTCAQHTYLCTEHTHLCTESAHLCTARLRLTLAPKGTAGASSQHTYLYSTSPKGIADVFSQKHTPAHLTTRQPTCF
eukprot:387588-Pelagomonas_calceolata.AAC.10